MVSRSLLLRQVRLEGIGELCRPVLMRAMPHQHSCREGLQENQTTEMPAPSQRKRRLGKLAREQRAIRMEDKAHDSVPPSRRLSGA